MSIKTILIEDEPLATEELKLLLQEHEQIEIIATAAEYREALDKINKLKPDLLFLDINMPEKNGFELLEELDEVPHVIFVTAHDQYAINAFETSALDYLLKPLNPERLSEAIEKTNKVFDHQQGQHKETEEIQSHKKIFIKDGDKCYFVPVADIIMIESMGNYAKVFYKDLSPLLHKSLNYLEQRLPSELFFRANRQQIINFNYIDEIHPFLIVRYVWI